MALTEEEAMNMAEDIIVLPEYHLTGYENWGRESLKRKQRNWLVNLGTV